MPKRTDINSILIIGAGPIVIGQACEFDYSGTQACKALREEGYRVILVNSNPATIMTDPEMADVVYIEPIHWKAIKKIIKKENPDALLPTMGGQTALNCALDLVREGVLDECGVELIAASQKAIDMAEDREQFREAMSEINLESPKAEIAHSLDEASSNECAISAFGLSKLISDIASRNCSLSSAISMAFCDAAISSTPHSSRTPSLTRSSAQLRAVWPPIVGSNASGFSFLIIFLIAFQ